MWVVYNKSTLKIAGVSALSDQDLDRQAAFDEIVAGLHGTPDPAEYDAIQVADLDKARRYMAAFPFNLAVVREGVGVHLSIRDPEFHELHITTDAPDLHPVDGIPEIPADGESSALISLRKIDERGTPASADSDNDTIYLRTDHGTLRDREGRQDISKVTLNAGVAEFRLFSDKTRRVATVRLFNADRKLRNAKLRIEFI